MSFSFLLQTGSTNTPSIPVGASNNGQSAVLHRKNATLTSTGNVTNGKALFTIPDSRVQEFAGSYSVTINGSVVQYGDIDVIITSVANSGGGGNVDLTNYPTKAETSSQIVGAVSAKADKTYVDSVVATKASLTDLAQKANVSDLKPVATSGSFTDLANKPDLSGYATTSALGTALAGKADASTVNSALAAKVSTTDLTAGLATKADTTNVYTKSAADAKFALIGSGGGGASAGNVLVLGPADPVPANTANGTIILRKAS